MLKTFGKFFGLNGVIIPNMQMTNNFNELLVKEQTGASLIFSGPDVNRIAENPAPPACFKHPITLYPVHARF